MERAPIAKTPGALRRLRETGRAVAGRAVFFLPFAITLFALRYPYVNYHRGALWAFSIIPATFVVPPLFDLFVGANKNNVPRNMASVLADAMEYVYLMRIWTILIVALVLWGAHTVSTADLQRHEIVGLTITIGLITGVIGIPVAHEMLHRSSYIDRALAEIIMSFVTYPHFCIEHIHGHHRYVGTIRDAATARFGHSYYKFLTISVPGQIRSAFLYERKRSEIAKTGLFNIRDRRFRYLASMAIIQFAIFLFAGVSGWIFFICQSAIAILLLEATNYVQHYGLVRKELDSGRFEPVNPGHSWNTAARYSNAALVNLGRHSDHHTTARLPFQVLSRYDEEHGPETPEGLPVLILAAFIPPIWFRLMDRRVLAARNVVHSHDVTGVSNETAEKCEILRQSISGGSIGVSCRTIPEDLAQNIVRDKIDQFGGWLLIAAIAMYNFSIIGFGYVAGLLVVTSAAIILHFVRKNVWKLFRAETIVQWAAHQPWNWPKLWNACEITLHHVDTKTAVTSPDGQWPDLLKQST